MAEVGSIYVRIGAQIDDFEAAMRKIEGSIKQAESRFEGMRAVGERLSSVGQKVALAGGAMATGFGFAVKTAADFEAQMSKVQALSGATEADFQRLRDAAIELGAQSVYSAGEAAQGMQILAAAGFDTNQIIAAMPGLLNAAAAAEEDFATVADIMVAAMSGFGLQARDMAHIADVLASAANASAISITDIGYSLKYIAPVAKTAGVNLEEVSAALAILGNAGIKAEQAGTTLRMALIRLADPPKEAAEIMEQLGIRVTDASGKMLPFQQIIAQLHDKFSGLSQAQKLQAAATIFGAEAMSGMLTLIEAGPQQLGALAAEFQNSSGAAQQMADTMTNNLAGALEQLKGALESAFIAIGTALTPAIQTIVGHIQNLVNWFNQLPEPVKQAISVAGALAAALTLAGGVILIFAGQILQGISAAKNLGLTLSALPKMFTLLIGPIGIAMAAIAAFVAIAYVVIKNWEPIKGFFSGLWKKVTGIFEDAVSSISKVITNTWDKISKTTSQIWEGIKNFFATWWPTLLLVFAGPLGYIVVWIVQHWDKVKATTTAIWNSIISFLSGIWGSIRSAAASLWNAISGAISGPMQTLNNTVTSIWSSIKASLTSAWNSLKSSASSIFSSIADAIVRPFRNIHIPMPHFEFTTVQKSMAGITFPVPKVSVRWYAEGGLFTAPTIIGVGERGPEAVLPLRQDVFRAIAQGISSNLAVAGAGGGDIIIQNMYVRNDTDIERIAQRLWQLQQARLRGQGR